MTECLTVAKRDRVTGGAHIWWGRAAVGTNGVAASLPVVVFGQPCVKRAAKVAEVGAENSKRKVVWREPLERTVAGAHELE
jgi:hypothetical protein